MNPIRKLQSKIEDLQLKVIDKAENAATRKMEKNLEAALADMFGSDATETPSATSATDKVYGFEAGQPAKRYGFES